MPLPRSVSVYLGSSALLLAALLRRLSWLPLIGGAYRAWACRLIRQSGLFDERFYRDNNRDLQPQAKQLLQHYVLLGDLEGRCPSACFDPAYYRLQARSQAARAQALLHYLLVGRHRRLAPSAWFDAEHYLQENKDIARARLEPLRHFLAEGAWQGRTPSSAFDSAAYLQAYPDLASSGLNPLLHYICEGRFQARRTRFGKAPDGASRPARASQAPDTQTTARLWPAGIAGFSGKEDWISAERLLAQLEWLSQESPCAAKSSSAPFSEPTAEPTAETSQHPGQSGPVQTNRGEGFESAIPARSCRTQLPIDVVVPVYLGRLETLRCLLSLLTARVQINHELVVINDASPDPVLREALRNLANAGQITLVEQLVNQGFVKSANLGLRLHPDRDVLLLNADTEVYDGWLDRLHRTALQHPNVGTVAPLSNNATICSYPRRGCDNPYPLELEYRELDALAAQINRGLSRAAPTSVGFCMLVRRACLDDVGHFDEDAFSPGYGEENDFSQRASRRGWVHLIAADVFVPHWGARSFRGEKGRHMTAAKAVIARRYPSYRQQVAAFEAADPLAEARRRLDWGRLARHRAEENVLIFHHRRGGGSARRVEAEISSLHQRGLGVFLLRPVSGDPTSLELSLPMTSALPNLPRFSITDAKALTQLLQTLGISEVRTHGLFDLVPDAVAYLERLVRSLGLRWVAYLHDYKVICPRVNLADRHGRYCGEQGNAQCGHCLALNGSEFGRPAIAAWRAMHRQALSAAALIRVPDEEVAGRIRRYFPELRLQVSANDGTEHSVTCQSRSSKPPSQQAHIVVIGAIGRRKGFDVLLRCARDARARGLGLRFTLMGFGLDDARLRAQGVEVSGRYPEVDAPGLLKRLSADLVWLPSTCPETFSYTLSLALSAGLPICAFDIGAIAARLRRLGIADGLVALSLADRPAALNRFLISLASGMPVRRPAQMPARAPATATG
ncbi:glycosyltransferase [Halochromatium sp.]